MGWETWQHSENGPMLWMNWRDSLAQIPVLARHEYLLCSDSFVEGSVLLGEHPYTLSSTAVHRSEAPKTGEPLSVILMTVEYTEERRLRGKGQRPSQRWDTWTGDVEDSQMAALLSVLLRIRCRSGGRVRPGSHSELDGPAPFLPGTDARFPYLPGLKHPESPPDLSAAKSYLRSYPKLPGPTALPLTRACELYQQAVWAVETDPSDSWLRLVSAIETASNALRDRRWESENKPSRLFEEFQPELALRIQGACPSKVYEEIADLFGRSHGATKMFLAFLTEFATEPDVLVRSSGIRNHLRDVYDARSKRLHRGTPMPSEMLSRVADERSLTVTRLDVLERSGEDDGTSPTSRLSLSAFEAVVRSALLGWWLRVNLEAEANW